MTAQPLFVAATASYLANCALGASVATGLVDTRRFRWVHHALYISTCVLAGAAASSLLWAPRKGAALALLPAAVPLAAIPSVSTHSRDHVRVALAAAPFFLASLALSRKS